MATGNTRRATPATRQRPANDRSSGLFYDRFTPGGCSCQERVALTGKGLQLLRDAAVCRLQATRPASIARTFPRDGKRR